MSTAAVSLAVQPLLAAWEAIDAAITAVMAVATSSAADEELLAAMVAQRSVAARLDAAGTALVREADARGTMIATGAPSSFAWLRGHLRLTPGAAAGQLHLVERLAMPRCAKTAAAHGAGTIHTAQAEVIARTLASLPDSVPVELLVRAEESLLEYAATLDATQLRNVAQQLRARLDPSSSASLARREYEQSENRTFSMSNCEDGFVRLYGQLDVEAAGWLRAALDSVSAPRAATEQGRDSRSAPRRRGDALVELAKLALAGGELPSRGGIRPTLFVTVDHHQLMNDIGTARLATGERISAGAARRLACDAKILPAVLGGASEVLDLGRATYTVSRALRAALVLRDQGCLNPTCNAPPDWCEAHHLEPYGRGGETNLNNMGLFCPHDHTLVHCGLLIVKMRANGIPLVTRARPGTARPL